MTLVELAAARALESVAQMVLDVSTLLFLAGLSRNQFAALDFPALCAFADQHRLPRLIALAVQRQLGGKADPLAARAIVAIES